MLVDDEEPMLFLMDRWLKAHWLIGSGLGEWSKRSEKVNDQPWFETIEILFFFLDLRIDPGAVIGDECPSLVGSPGGWLVVE